MPNEIPGTIQWQPGASPVKGEAELYYENTDIEDIVNRWENVIENQQVWTLLCFLCFGVYMDLHCLRAFMLLVLVADFEGFTC